MQARYNTDHDARNSGEEKESEGTDAGWDFYLKPRRHGISLIPRSGHHIAPQAKQVQLYHCHNNFAVRSSPNIT